MEKYRLTANGKKWNDKDENINIIAATPEQAITKARILKGEDFYRRLYYVAVITKEGLWDIADLCSYGMVREQMRRDFGRNYYVRRVSA